MELSPGQENWVQMVLTAPLAEATQTFDLPAKRMQGERTLKASRLVEPRQVWENRLVQAKLESPWPVLAAWRSDLPRRAFFALTRRLLPPWRD
jgi:hypothetical protein